MDIVSALRSVDVRVKLIALIAYFVLAFHAHTPAMLAAVAVVALLAAVITRVRIAQARRVLVGLLFVVALTVVMQLVYWQEGSVLAQWGPVAITDEGVWRAVRMVVAQVSVVLASVAFAHIVEPSEMVSAFSWALRPLAYWGIDTKGIVLSLTVAIAFVPLLVREFTTLRAAHWARAARFDGSVRERLASYTRLFAPLVRSSLRHADNLAEALLARAL